MNELFMQFKFTIIGFVFALSVSCFCQKVVKPGTYANASGTWTIILTKHAIEDNGNAGSYEVQDDEMIASFAGYKLIFQVLPGNKLKLVMGGRENVKGELLTLNDGEKFQPSILTVSKYIFEPLGTTWSMNEKNARAKLAKYSLKNIPNGSGFGIDVDFKGQTAAVFFQYENEKLVKTSLVFKNNSSVYQSVYSEISNSYTLSDNLDLGRRPDLNSDAIVYTMDYLWKTTNSNCTYEIILQGSERNEIDTVSQDLKKVGSLEYVFLEVMKK